jgi:hypothetical protein
LPNISSRSPRRACVIRCAYVTLLKKPSGSNGDGQSYTGRGIGQRGQPHIGRRALNPIPAWLGTRRVVRWLWGAREYPLPFAREPRSPAPATLAGAGARSRRRLRAARPFPCYCSVARGRRRGSPCMTPGHLVSPSQAAGCSLSGRQSRPRNAACRKRTGSPCGRHG